MTALLILAGLLMIALGVLWLVVLAFQVSLLWVRLLEAGLQFQERWMKETADRSLPEYYLYFSAGCKN